MAQQPSCAKFVKNSDKRAYHENGGDTYISQKLEEIRDLQPNNGQVAWLMAQIYSYFGDVDAESRCLTTAIEAGVNEQGARRRRAAIARLEDRSEDALSDLHAILADGSSPTYDFVAAAELLREFDPSWISVVAKFASAQSS